MEIVLQEMSIVLSNIDCAISLVDFLLHTYMYYEMHMQCNENMLLIICSFKKPIWLVIMEGQKNDHR